MAKVQALEWNAFMRGEVKVKSEVKQKINPLTAVIVVTSGLVVANQIAAFAIGPESIPALSAIEPSFQESLSRATKPIKDLIYGFGHEIYGVFMAWGALEAMIGKPQQGFTRMKTATFAYVLLWWVPWIVDRVGGAIKPY